METDLAKRIISELKSKEVCEKITFHVMGEPTMHRDFFEILEYAAETGMNVGLTTNGRRLGGNTGRRLIDYDLSQVDISLQTPDAESFKLRKAGSLSFEDYLDGILEFFAAYQKRHNDTIFKFRFLNTRFRKKSLEERVGPLKVISSTSELRKTFRFWTDRIYRMMGVDGQMKDKAMDQIGKLVSYKWNVVEIYPKVFFETYVLDDWGHAFEDGKVRDAWGGYCFGMRDHFSILYNGDVTLCCIDFDGHTAIGNLYNQSLEDILSSDKLGKIMKGFKRYRLVDPYCKRCLGSSTFSSWLLKPVAGVAGLKVLKPFFHHHTRIYE
jgi:MoaA/NifB/PqqE/SkfB family radical SAM enzyme